MFDTSSCQIGCDDNSIPDDGDGDEDNDVVVVLASLVVVAPAVVLFSSCAKAVVVIISVGLKSTKPPPSASSSVNAMKMMMDTLATLQPLLVPAQKAFLLPLLLPIDTITPST